VALSGLQNAGNEFTRGCSDASMRQVAFFFFTCAVLLNAKQAVVPGSSRVLLNPPNSNTDPETNLPLEKLGAGDLVSVSVLDCPELTRNFRVTNDGMLQLPLLKEKIEATGKYPDQIEDEITQALVKDQLLVRPVVSVSVAEYRSVPVSVMGAVRHPLTFQAVGDVKLLDALARAEGLSPEAGSEILVSRPHSPGSSGSSLLERIPVKGLLDQANPELNIRLQGGEEIRVPAAGRVYVVGSVKRSGAFPIQDDSTTTVLKAIALSEGLAPYSSKKAFIFRRESGGGNKSEIPIPLDKIMQRKSPDVTLEANDILYIPDSRGKRVTAETLQTLTGFGINTASGILIWK
jgi:polysaccharide export outer membrane protein